MPRRALITGIGGQDGSYLAELLLGKGYEVHGVVRAGDGGAEPLESLRDRVGLHEGDLLDPESLLAAVRSVEPDEVYNLAAMSHVVDSWGDAALSADGTAVGVVRLLDAIRVAWPRARFFQASSSEVFPGSGGRPQDESTPLHPRTPYGAAKAYGQMMTEIYRQRHGLFACSGVLFNHESPRRSPRFVTRKITRAVAAIKLGRQSTLGLGNLDARRDWGYAPEYVEAMWLMLQREEPEDFVIGTGESHSIRDFAEAAFAEVGLDPGEHLEADPAALRPVDEDFALADPSRASERLGWTARTRFAEIVRLMVAADLERLACE